MRPKRSMGFDGAGLVKLRPEMVNLERLDTRLYGPEAYSVVRLQFGVGFLSSFFYFCFYQNDFPPSDCHWS